MLGESAEIRHRPPIAGSTFHVTRNGDSVLSIALDADMRDVRPLELSEVQFIGFEVERREPDAEYRVRIGNAMPGETEVFDSATVAALGHARGRGIFWDDRPYFESARGRSLVSLESRSVGALEWRVRVTVVVLVAPSKLGEARYARMYDDLYGLAAGLVFDLVSKSIARLGLRSDELPARSTVVAGGVSQLELRRLELSWHSLSRALLEIERDPATTLRRRTVVRECWGGERLSTGALRSLAAVGVDPRHVGVERPFRASINTAVESTHTVEQQRIMAVLQLLAERARTCGAGAAAQRARLERDRPERDIVVGDGPSLYASVDLPRMARLAHAEERAAALARSAAEAARRPFLRGVHPVLGPLRSPVFQHVPAYRRFREAAEQLVRGSLVVVDNGDTEQLKSTSRMYEQWVFLQLVSAFRAAGLRSESVEQVVRPSGWQRYTLDIERGARVTFRDADGRVLIVSYEPWIHPRDVAQERRESVYRGRSGTAAWSPDVLIEVLEAEGARGEVAPVSYGLVVDAKYSRILDESHWSPATRYLDIKSTRTDRQVVHQVWLAHPDPHGEIRARDADVMWTQTGPLLPHGDRLLGAIPLTPDVDTDLSSEGLPRPTMVAEDFARGILAYVGLTRREPDEVAFRT